MDRNRRRKNIQERKRKGEKEMITASILTITALFIFIEILVFIEKLDYNRGNEKE